MLRFSKIAAAAKPKTNFFKSQKDDPFLRNATTNGRGTLLSKPLSVRIAASFVVGLSFGVLLEIFMCETKLYEIVMLRKTDRRHEIDEFTVNFRANMLDWQNEDMKRAQLANK